MKKITKLMLTLALCVLGVGSANADSKTTLDQLKAANGTDAEWLSRIPTSYPLNVLDNVLFGSDASSQDKNADVNKFDYIYFVVSDYVSERAVRVFFWDAINNKRIDYFLKPVADKETADYTKNTTVSGTGTYCVKIPVGARLQGAKTPWTSSPASVPYFKFSEIYLTERPETYIEATETFSAPATTTDFKSLTGTNGDWSSSVIYPTEFAVQGNYWGKQGSGEETHVNIENFDYLCFYIPAASENSVALRVWIWDDNKVKTLYAYPIANYSTADYTQEYRISAGGTYVVNVTDYKYFKGVKAENNWGAPSVIVNMAWASKGAAPIAYVPTGSYSLTGDIAGSPSLTAALADANATSYDATGVTGTGVTLTPTNPNALFIANAGALANTQNVIVDDVCANLVLTDGHPFKAPANFTATAASYSTTINTTAKAGTLCLPFAATIPEGVKAYTLEYESGDKVTATKIDDGTIPANTPVLLNGEGDVTFTGAGSVNAAATNAGGALTGVFEKTPVPVNSFVLQNGGEGVGFYKVASTAIYANPFRAYLTAQAYTSRLSIVFADEEEEVTGIQTVKAAKNNGMIFNLNGQRMNKLNKGLNIIGGKKVMVK